MYRIMPRFGFVQKKLLARCFEGHQYEMVLYNEKPQSSVSLVVSFHEHRAMRNNWSNEVNTIRRSSTRILSLTESNCVVVSTYSSDVNIPVVVERIDNEGVPVIKLVDFIKWFAKTEDSGNKDAVQPGGRLGRLDAANEAGFFHRTDRSRLKEIKKKLKDKPESAPTEPKKTG